MNSTIKCPACGHRMSPSDAKPVLTASVIAQMTREAADEISEDPTLLAYVRQYAGAADLDFHQLVLDDYDAIRENKVLSRYIFQNAAGTYYFQNQVSVRQRVSSRCCPRCHMVLPPVLFQEDIHDQKTVLLIGPTSAGKTTFLGALFATLPASALAFDVESEEYCYYRRISMGLQRGEAPPPTRPELEAHHLNRQPLFYVYNRRTKCLYVFVDTPGEVMEGNFRIDGGEEAIGLFLLNCDIRREEITAEANMLQAYLQRYRGAFSKVVLNFTQCDVLGGECIRRFMLHDGSGLSDAEMAGLALAQKISVRDGLLHDQDRAMVEPLRRVYEYFAETTKDIPFSAMFSASLGCEVVDSMLTQPFHPQFIRCLMHAVLY